MIQVNSVTAALHGLLGADPVLTSSGFHISEGEAFNDDINRTPWVGIYHGNLAIDPHTLGGAQPWQGELELYLYVQEAGHGGGQEVTRALNAAQARVLDVLNANRTLLGSVQGIQALRLSPFQRDLREDAWMFSNEISLKTTLRG